MSVAPTGRSLIVSAVAASLALGCYQPRYDDCNIKCGPRRMCPEKMVCVDDYCTHSSGCGNASTDASIEVPDGPEGLGAPDAPDAPWTPAVIPNLVLWLESDRGLEARPGEKVFEWRDQSPLHNDARQTTEMFAPTLAADSFNGRPGLEFITKAWMVINDDLSLRWGVFDFLVLVVFRATDRCEGECVLQQLYRKQEVERPWRGPGLGLQPGGMIEVHLDHDTETQWLNSPAAGYDSGRIHLAGGQRLSGWPGVRVDGADYPSLRPFSATNLDAPGANVYIGAHGLNPNPPLDFPFHGHIGAIVAVQGPISAADLAKLESYLMAKYGVVPGGPP